MENKRNQNKQLLNQIYKNNYFHEMNPNSKKYPHSFQIFSPQSRGKTPIYTRVKNLLNIETNNINTNKPREEYEIYSGSNNSSNNNINNNMINKNTNLNIRKKRTTIPSAKAAKGERLPPLAPPKPNLQSPSTQHIHAALQHPTAQIAFPSSSS